PRDGGDRRGARGAPELGASRSADRRRVRERLGAGLEAVMKYRVSVHGKAFDLDVTEGPEGTLVGGKKAALLGRHGPLAALVREGSSLGVSVEPGLEDGAFFVQLPGGRVLACHVEDERAQLAHRSLGGAAGEHTGPRTVRAVMPGIVVKVAVAPGTA